MGSSEPPPFPKPHYPHAEEHVHGGEWPMAILEVIAPKDEDSTGMKVLKFGGIIVSPVVIGPAALAGFAFDEITHPLGLPIGEWISGDLDPYYDVQELIDWQLATVQWANELAAKASGK